MVNQKLKIIFTLFLLSSLFNMSAFSQTEKIYNLSIKDETGEEIGQYFDVKIDSIYIPSDTTLNFQLIPNIEIEDSVLKNKYSTFLEMLISNINAEIDKRWKDLSFDFGNYQYEGLDYDDRFKAIGNEINSLVSKTVIKESNDASILVDYSSWDDSNISIISSDSFGKPLEGILHKKNFALDSDELSYDIKLAYLKTLFLNNKIDEDLLDTDGNFTIDAINLIKILISIQNDADLHFFMNEENWSPVAIVRVDADTFFVGQTINLIGSDSFDPDGNIVHYSWKQLHGDSLTLDFMTENEGMLTDENLSTAQFVAEWPGIYKYELTVEDYKGIKNSNIVDVIVKAKNLNTFKYNIINLFDVKENDISGLEEHTIKKIKKDIGVYFLDFVNIFWYTQINPLPVIDRMIGDPFLQITDEFIGNFLSQAKNEGFSICLSQQLFPAPNVPFPPNEPKSQEWWDAWFAQFEPIIIHQAELAEQYNVEIFNMYYIDLANIFDPRNNILSRLKDLLSNIREKYSGLIAITSGNGGTPENPFNVCQYQDILYDENIDLIIFNYSIRLFEKTDPIPNLVETREKIIASLINKGNGNESFVEIASRINKPFIFHYRWNSANRQNEFEFFEATQENPNVIPNFYEQVNLYEASIQAILDNRISKYVDGIIVLGYFWNDMFDVYYPPHNSIVNASADRSPNIRNKPTENLIKLWFDILSN